MNSSSALDLCEEAVHLLRRAPRGALFIYYLGSIPFVLGLLFFWTDMSESANARDHAASASLGLAVLYLCMITCQAIFARKLRMLLALNPETRTSVGEWLGTMAAQASIQPTKFIVLPIAGLMTVPFATVYAIYHNASVITPLATARRQAALWPGQNWSFLGILSMLGIVVFLNVGMGLVLFPYLLKMLAGVDSVFTRSSYTFLNTTFLAVTAGLSYLVINPFVKAFYVLRCFYGEALTTAEDLRAELNAGSLALMMGLIGCLGAFGQTGPVSLKDDLNHSIDRVLQKPEYSWRTPRAPRTEAERHNWIVRSTLSFMDATGRAFRQAGRWIDALVEKIGDLMGQRSLPDPGQPDHPPPARNLRALVVLLLAIATSAIVFLLWQWLAKRRVSEPVIAVGGGISIDLQSEDLQADQQPPEQWLALARGCVERQEFRLALRAIYLAGLSTLATGSLIALQRGKSDGDYALELKRRARNRPELVAAFTHTLHLFERGWYGMYEVGPAMIDQVQGNLERMRTHAQ